jgi:hypothetical protein
MSNLLPNRGRRRGSQIQVADALVEAAGLLAPAKSDEAAAITALLVRDSFPV